MLVKTPVACIPLQGCIITAPDYDSLQLVYTARRLWQSDDVMPPPEQKQDMNRRFAESYKILAQVAGGSLSRYWLKTPSNIIGNILRDMGPPQGVKAPCLRLLVHVVRGATTLL